MITFKFVLIYDDCNNLNLSFLYIFFILFADVYNLLLCNVYSGGPQGRLDLSICVASVNKVVIIIIIIIIIVIIIKPEASGQFWSPLFSTLPLAKLLRTGNQAAGTLCTQVV